jgi:hypothetical protein
MTELESTRYIKVAAYFGVILFFAVIVAGLYDVLSFLAFDIFRVLIFTLSVVFFIWYYKITETHVPSYERITEGAILCAIIFNPFLVFKLDLAVWIFLEGVFMWVYVIFIYKIKKVEKNLLEGNYHWLNME